MDQGTCATALKVMRAILIYPKVAKVTISISSNKLYKSLEIKISNCRSNNFSQQIIISSFVIGSTTQNLLVQRIKTFCYLFNNQLGYFIY
jgi:hypothetical protein